MRGKCALLCGPSLATGETALLGECAARRSGLPNPKAGPRLLAKSAASPCLALRRETQMSARMPAPQGPVLLHRSRLARPPHPVENIPQIGPPPSAVGSLTTQQAKDRVGHPKCLRGSVQGAGASQALARARSRPAIRNLLSGGICVAQSLGLCLQLGL